MSNEPTRATPDKGSSWRTQPGCLPVGVGVVLILLGIPMLVCPGPGIASILLGGSLVAVGLGRK